MTLLPAAILTLAGFLALAASAARFKSILLAPPPSPRDTLRVRRTGVLLLVAALLQAMLVAGVARGLVTFVGLSTIAAALAIVVVNWRRAVGPFRRPALTAPSGNHAFEPGALPAE